MHFYWQHFLVSVCCICMRCMKKKSTRCDVHNRFWLGAQMSVLTQLIRFDKMLWAVLVSEWVSWIDNELKTFPDAIWESQLKTVRRLDVYDENYWATAVTATKERKPQQIRLCMLRTFGVHARTHARLVLMRVYARISIELISSWRHNRFRLSCVFTINDSLAQCNVLQCNDVLTHSRSHCTSLVETHRTENKKQTRLFTPQTIMLSWQHFTIDIVIIIIFNFCGFVVCCYVFLPVRRLSLGHLRSMNFNTELPDWMHRGIEIYTIAHSNTWNHIMASHSSALLNNIVSTDAHSVRACVCVWMCHITNSTRMPFKWYASKGDLRRVKSERQSEAASERTHAYAYAIAPVTMAYATSNSWHDIHFAHSIKIY